jgi:hypothetical protein
MIVYKILAALALIGAIFAGGYRVAENKLQPIINERDAQLLAIDLKAKQDEQKYKEVSNAIKVKDDKYRAAIARYERMLHTTDNISPGETPINPGRVDEAASEPEIIRCLDDARVRAGMAEFFRLNQFPIEDAQ